LEVQFEIEYLLDPPSLGYAKGEDLADLVPAWRPRLQLVDVVRTKVAGLTHPTTRSRQTSNVCAQDLSNARGVNAPVTDSLRVR